MTKDTPIYKVQFICNGQRYELFVKTLRQDSLYGFVEIGDFVWDTHTELVLDPSHERLKDEFMDVTSTFVPLHNILRIDTVKKQGTAKISELSDKVATFPNPIYTPKK